MTKGARAMDLHSAKLPLGVHCNKIRHKGMYTGEFPNPGEGRFFDAYDAGAYWCAETATGFGPDGQPVRPTFCRAERAGVPENEKGQEPTSHALNGRLSEL